MIKNLTKEIQGIHWYYNSSIATRKSYYMFYEKDTVDFNKSIQEIVSDFVGEDYMLKTKMINVGGSDMNQILTKYDVVFIRNSESSIHFCSYIGSIYNSNPSRTVNDNINVTISDVIKKSLSKNKKSIAKGFDHCGLCFMPLSMVIRLHIVNKEDKNPYRKGDYYISTLLSTKQINAISKIALGMNLLVI